MFKHRSILIKPVRDKDINGGNPIIAGDDGSSTDPFEGVQVASAYAEVAKDFITHTALVVGGVFAACKIIERICK